MQYDVTSPEDYLNALVDDWRKETLLKIREYLLSPKLELKEGINYKMLSYEGSMGNVFHLNAQKGYVSLYVGNISKVDPSNTVLTGPSLGKGCVRFTKTVRVEESGVADFIALAVQLSVDGEDIDC